MTRATGAVFLIIGSSLLTLAIWGLWRDIGWIAQPFYAYSWWGYIFILDGFCAVRRGHSLFTTRYRFVLPIAFWSVSFWFFFEFLNLRFQNWYYVGVPQVQTLTDLALGGLFVTACFSTVFFGLFETFEALTAAGLWRYSRGKPQRLPTWVSYAVQGLGAAMVMAATCFPYYLAPLIWGSFTFLIDPWNYRRGVRSILRDIEARDWGLVARIFVAGLICGLVWESLNFFAPQKWIYTVRGLENLKLFEMPLLGFLGFPGLAYDCMAGFALLSSLFLRHDTWEHPYDLSYSVRVKPRVQRWVFWISIPIQIQFWGLVVFLYLNVGTTFGSLELRLEDLTLTATEYDALRDLGIRRPRQLLRGAQHHSKRLSITNRTGWSNARLDAVLAKAELYTFKGIGANYGRALKHLGIHGVTDLADWQPESLHQELRMRIFQEHEGPRLDMVRVWVLASQNRGVFLRHSVNSRE